MNNKIIMNVLIIIFLTNVDRAYGMLSKEVENKTDKDANPIAIRFVSKKEISSQKIKNSSPLLANAMLSKKSNRSDKNFREKADKEYKKFLDDNKQIIVGVHQKKFNDFCNHVDNESICTQKKDYFLYDSLGQAFTDLKLLELHFSQQNAFCNTLHPFITPTNMSERMKGSFYQMIHNFQCLHSITGSWNTPQFYCLIQTSNQILRENKEELVGINQEMIHFLNGVDNLDVTYDDTGAVKVAFTMIDTFFKNDKKEIFKALHIK